jgi:hypothetical protein
MTDKVPHWVPEEAKPWWASRTLIVNAVTLVAVVAAGAGLDIFADVEFKAEITTGALAVANIVLRVITKGPVK